MRLWLTFKKSVIVKKNIKEIRVYTEHSYCDNSEADKDDFPFIIVDLS